MNEQRLVVNTLTACTLVLIVTAIAALLFIARHLLPLVFGAILIAVVLNRVAAKLGRCLPDSLSRRIRVALVIGTLTLVTFVSVYAFANSASEQIVRLNDRVNASVETVVKAAKEQPLVKRYVVEQSNVSSLLPSSTESLGLAKNFFATAFGGLADCLILVILSAYFGFSPDKYRTGAICMVPIGWRDRLSSLLDESGETLWLWMLGRLLAMLLVGLVFGIGLALIGIPMPVELGIFAALVTFIPNIGGIAAVVPALLLASQQGSTSAISVLTLYACIQFFESYLVTPMVQEHQISLPPVMVILAQIVAGLVFGFWGVVFATPLVAIVMLWTKRLYIEGWLCRHASLTRSDGEHDDGTEDRADPSGGLHD